MYNIFFLTYISFCMWPPLLAKMEKNRGHRYLTPETNTHTHTCPITTTNNSNIDNIRKLDLRKQKTVISEIWEMLWASLLTQLTALRKFLWQRRGDWEQPCSFLLEEMELRVKRDQAARAFGQSATKEGASQAKRSAEGPLGCSAEYWSSLGWGHYHINKQKRRRKKWNIIAKGQERTFDKIQHLFLIKVLSK